MIANKAEGWTLPFSQECRKTINIAEQKKTNKAFEIFASENGYVTRMDMPHIQDIKTRLLSTRPFESLLLRKKIGDWVQRDDILAELYLSSIKNPRKLEADIRKIYVLSDKPPPFSPLIAEKTKSGF